jgi:hypothetical protein
VNESPEPSANPPAGSKEVTTDVGLKFLAGAILPFIIALLLARAYSLNASQASENYRYEEKITVSSEDNSTFEWTLNIPEDYPRITQFVVGSAWNYESLAGGEHTVHIGRGFHENDWSSRLTVTQYNASENYQKREIGYYEPANQTIFFQLENASYEQVTLWVNYNSDGSLGSKFSWWTGRLIALTAGVAAIGSLVIATRYHHTAFGKGVGTGLLVGGGVVLVLMVVGSLLGNFAACATSC